MCSYFTKNKCEFEEDIITDVVVVKKDSGCDDTFEKVNYYNFDVSNNMFSTIKIHADICVKSEKVKLNSNFQDRIDPNSLVITKSKFEPTNKCFNKSKDLSFGTFRYDTHAYLCYQKNNTQRGIKQMFMLNFKEYLKCEKGSIVSLTANLNADADHSFKEHGEQ